MTPAGLAQEWAENARTAAALAPPPPSRSTRLQLLLVLLLLLQVDLDLGGRQSHLLHKVQVGVADLRVGVGGWEGASTTWRQQGGGGARCRLDSMPAQRPGEATHRCYRGQRRHAT